MRKKPTIILAVALLSAYLLVPTFGQFKEKTAALQDEEMPTPWYYSLFQKKEVNLGLDLKGGIYLELEVRMTEALTNRIDLISTRLTNLLEDEKIEIKATREDKPLRLLVETKTLADLSSLRGIVANNYRGALFETSSAANTATFALTEDFENEIKELTMTQAVETIRNRIDRFGVSEPAIHRLSGFKVSVELPGIKDPERAIEMIKKAGRLEFKLVDEAVKPADLQLWVAEARSKHNLKENYSIKTVERLNELLIKKLPKGDELAFQLTLDPVTRKVVGGTPFALKKKVELTGDMLKDARRDTDPQRNRPYVSLTFNNVGAKLFQNVTGDNVGKRLAILLDGNVMSDPVIQNEIAGGSAQITLGAGTTASLQKEAKDLVLVLKEGALPARMEELTKTVIGPSLGQASIDQGIRVTLFGGLLVVIFMLVYYKRSGLFANISLLLNIALIFALLTLFGGTLTLPGIAAIVLTIGMAVDANVIIFERIREELRAGESGKTAVANGYGNAMSAIIDANVTTMLVGIVLYQFGTGPIRGFAVTLMIGILTTLFTALYVTRFLQDWALNRSGGKISL